MPRPKLTKYNRCWCGSGSFYKDCHIRIDAAPPSERLQAAHAQYRDNWIANASHFDQAGAYNWMASKLGSVSPKVILDIGTGTGQGIEALLLAYNCKIITVDENRECLRTAAERLSGKGYDVAITERLRFNPVLEKLHDLVVLPGLLQASAQVSLIEADWLALDPEFFAFLESQPKFDALTVWLIGTHSLRQQSTSALAKRIETSGAYRLFVQNKAFVVADKILQPGGLLQIVDRGVAAESNILRENLLAGFREQASVTSLQIVDYDSIPYTEAERKARVPMEITSGPSGYDGQQERLEMVSILAQKPLSSSPSAVHSPT